MEIRVRATGAVMYEDAFRRWVRETDGATFDQVTPEILEQFDADPVFEGAQATGGEPWQYSVRDGVKEINGQWFTSYVIGPVFGTPEAEEAFKARRTEEQADAVRADRNRRLTECDWTQLADAPVGQAAWASYRQALRDLPDQPGFPWAITWPVPPA